MADFINVLTEIRGKGATTGSVLDLSNSIPRTGDLIDSDGSDVETNRLYESNHSVYADIKNSEWKIGNYTQGFKEDKEAIESSGVQDDMHTVAGMTSEITYLGGDSEGRPKIDMLYADLNDSNSLLNTVVNDVTAIKDETYTYRTSALTSRDEAVSARLTAETKSVDAEVAKRNAELYSSEEDDVTIRLWRNESNVPVLEPVASGGYSSKHWRNKAAGISTGTELTGKIIYDKSNKVAANSTVVKALGTETISAGTIVKITSESAATDNTTIVSPCTTNSDDVLGICVSTIDTVTSGLIVTHGSVMDIDTTAFTGELYIGPDGQLSNDVNNQSVGFVAKRDVSGMLYVTFSNANLNVYSKEYLDSKLLTVSESVQVYTGIVNGKLEMNSGNGKVKIGSEDMTVCIPGGYDNGYAVNTLIGTLVSSSFGAGSDLSFDTGYELKPNSTSYVFVDSDGLFRAMDSAPTKLGRSRTRLGERIDAYRDGRWSVSNNGLNRINSGSLSDTPTDVSAIPSADWVSTDGGQLSSNLFSGDGVNTTSSLHRTYTLEANTKYRLKYSANATTNGQNDSSKPFISLSGSGVNSTIINYFSSGANQINREFTSSALGGDIEFKLAVGGTASDQFELTEIELFEVTYKESYKYGTQNGVPSWANKKIAYLPYKITTDGSALVTSVEYDARSDFIDLVGEVDSRDNFFDPEGSGLVSDNVHDALIELDSDVSTKANSYGDSSKVFKVSDAVNGDEAVNKSQLDTKANKSGDNSEVFNVADSVNGYEAVNKRQLDTKADKVGDNSQVFKVADGTNYDEAISLGQLSGSIGIINSPLLDLPLKNSLAMKAGVGSVTFSRNTTATYIDRYGVLQYADIDEPRFERDGLLIEGSSTNYNFPSDNVSGWEYTNCTSSNSTSLSPDGTVSGNTITIDTFNVNWYIRNTTSYQLQKDVPCTFSVWLKSEQNISCYMLIRDSSNSNQGDFGGSKLVDLTNVFQRFEFTVTPTEYTSGYAQIYIDPDSSNSGDTFEIWGAQTEQLPFASSYIPTTDSAVTRGDDNCSVDNSNFPQATDGFTFLMDITSIGFINSKHLINFGNSDSAGYIQQYGDDDFVWWNGSDTNTSASSDMALNTNLTGRTANIGAQVENGYPIVVDDGVFIGTRDSRLVSGNRATNLSISGSFCKYKNLKFYDKALTETEVKLIGGR